MQHEVTMAEINKLSVGKVLDKLRRDDAPKNVKTNQLDKKIRTAEEEIERLRAASLRLKRGHRGGAAGRD
jgi:TolA-binding protein